MAGKAIRTGRGCGYSGVAFLYGYKNSGCENPFGNFTATSVAKAISGILSQPLQHVVGQKVPIPKIGIPDALFRFGLSPRSASGGAKFLPLPVRIRSTNGFRSCARVQDRSRFPPVGMMHRAEGVGAVEAGRRIQGI